MPDDASPSNDTTPSGDRAVVPLWKQRNFVVGAGVLGVIIVVVLAAIVFAAGGGDDDAETVAGPTTTDGDATTTVPTTEPGAPPPIAPLTGLPDESLVTLIQPALLVKIDNVPLTQRPDQAGIDQADVVWEEPVEGATRLFGVWHSQVPDRIGPIRSTRLIDAGIAWQFGEVPYVYSGGTAEKVSAINESPVQTIDEGGLASIDARERDSNIRAPHNLFANPPENVWSAAVNRTAPAPLFGFLAEDKDFEGLPVAGIEIPNLNRAEYSWDEGAGAWLRSQLRGNGATPEPHLAESGDQVAVTNVIIQRINGTDPDGVLGEGDAWVLVDGEITVGRWERGALEDRTVFRTADGDEILLRPGNTWIHLITSGQGDPTVVPVEAA